ncbi:MbcA/ParS/Xre antitoxin family protein [Paenibacillus polysaccharolyticus]|uniref:antitoxin Xre/MbcA/ParS toxin-binding domain-containing protein n=1 Tax=Paenibacillus polysaccharolyticus TaxID=582692 RepID=UPI0020A1D71D|nr:antitoxin Xre/MbcA/ParS toxin-binding domain-containing protein [Paenibacillus polysaccharolyticus]MCP1132454.1 MbcA/ParS/Xre antitoxin family protein [Paenibacillus polysaccharolyticus]
MSMQDMYLSAFKQEHWDNFVELFDEWYAQLPDEWKEEARLRGIPEDIGRVLLCEMKDSALKWIDKKVPALGDQSPASYLETEEGTNALRAAILRMPR